jgi:phage shock protein C
MEQQKLQKSSTDKIIFGVCGGIAEYFDIDPIIVRALFALVTIAGGSGVVVYIILAVIMPEKDTKAKTQQEIIKENSKQIEAKAIEMADNVEKTFDSNKSKQIGGIILIIIGIIFLFDTLGYPFVGALIRLSSRLWPLILVFAGFMLVVKKDNGKK